MQYLFELVGELFLTGLGALIKRLFGRPISESGTSETWIGVLVVAAVIAILVIVNSQLADCCGLSLGRTPSRRSSSRISPRGFPMKFYVYRLMLKATVIGRTAGLGATQIAKPTGSKTMKGPAESACAAHRARRGDSARPLQSGRSIDGVVPTLSVVDRLERHRPIWRSETRKFGLRPIKRFPSSRTGPLVPKASRQRGT